MAEYNTNIKVTVFYIFLMGSDNSLETGGLNTGQQTHLLYYVQNELLRIPVLSLEALTNCNMPYRLEHMPIHPSLINPQNTELEQTYQGRKKAFLK